MACTIDISSAFKTIPTVPAGYTESYIYNGYVILYDDDPDNLAQFIDVPANPPGELPAPGNPIIGTTVDPDGHTAGYYSITRRVTDGGDTDDENYVMNIQEQPDAGTSFFSNKCVSDDTFNLYTEWNVFSPPSPVGSWDNQIDVNNYAGYDGVTLNDITDDTFTPGTAGTGTYDFVYVEEASSSPSCIDCRQETTLQIIVDRSCCTGEDFCYEVTLDFSTDRVHGFTLDSGTLDSTTASAWFNFPYTLSSSQDVANLSVDLNNWLVNHGGGTGVVSGDTNGNGTITINNPCNVWTNVCTASLCGSSIAFSTITCKV